MRTIAAVAVLASCMASPAFANVYKCNSGGKTVYQDEPCANAKVVDNINALPPSRSEQIKAVQRAQNERNLAEQLGRNREAREPSVISVTQTAVSPGSALPSRPNGPDRYHDRQDRFEHRTVVGPARIQDQRVSAPPRNNASSYGR